MEPTRGQLDPASAEARARAQAFQLTCVPEDFVDDPYPYYALLRTHDPVHELGPGSWVRRIA